jgi:hypothetical protein
VPDKLWEIFHSKGIRTIFFSIGTSSSALADLDIAESLGCPIHVVPFTAEDRAGWEQVTEVLKTRKAAGAAADAPAGFAEGAEKNWVLPKNIRLQPALPWWTRGTLDLSGGSLATVPALEVVDAACQGMKLKKEDSPRLDILKIDTVGAVAKAAVPHTLGGQIALSILESGFRPSLLLIHWPASPDVDIPTSIHAGSIQTMGYRLIAKKDRKFLYYYTDVDMFQCCSWEDDTCNNPMIKEVLQAAQQQQR